MTIGIYSLLLALILVMRFFPDSEAGRVLNRELVEEPLRRLSQVKRHHLIFAVLLTVMLLSAGETIVMLGTADFVALYALDLSIYLDAMLVTYTLAVATRMRSATSVLHGRAFALAARLLRPFGRRRIRRQETRRPERKPSNDDDPAPFPVPLVLVA